MKIGVFPGSFDPLTNGHLDIIERAKRICDKLFIAIAINSAKKPLFSIQERMEIINNCLEDKDSEKIEIISFEGLLVDFCRNSNVSYIIRGLRSVTDFDYELTLASANRKLAPEIETIFLMTRAEYVYVSSNVVREIASYEGDIAPFVPPYAALKIRQKYSSRA